MVSCERKYELKCSSSSGEIPAIDISKVLTLKIFPFFFFFCYVYQITIKFHSDFSSH